VLGEGVVDDDTDDMNSPFIGGFGHRNSMNLGKSSPSPSQSSTVSKDPPSPESSNAPSVQELRTQINSLASQMRMLAEGLEQLDEGLRKRENAETRLEPVTPDGTTGSFDRPNPSAGVSW